MILEQCPHCGVRHVQTTHQFDGRLDARNGTVSWKVERCQNNACQHLVLVQVGNHGEVQQIYPFVAYKLDSSASISEEIKSDFREAGLCLGAGCYKASLA